MLKRAGSAATLVILALAGVALVAWAAWAVRRHWDFLDAYRLAGVALFEVLFLAITVAGASVVAYKERRGGPAEMALRWLQVAAFMSLLSLAVGLVILAVAWAWLLFRTTTDAVYERYPILGILLVFGIAGLLWLFNKRLDRSLSKGSKAASEDGAQDDASS